LLGLRVVIYPNDHPPRHIHVMDAEHEARFALDDGGAVTLMENYGFRRRRLEAIRAELEARREALIAEWVRIHGQ
jgi:hypothetical protein